MYEVVVTYKLLFLCVIFEIILRKIFAFVDYVFNIMIDQSILNLNVLLKYIHIIIIVLNNL